MTRPLVAGGNSCNAFFSEPGTDRYVPRAVFVDMEPSSLINFALVPTYYCQFDHTEQLITGKEDVLTNYTSSHYTIGK